MELTKQNFEDFKARLVYWNQGEGAKDHITKNPIFIVQKLERIYGFDSGYSDKSVIVKEDSEFESVEKLFESLDDEQLEKILNNVGCKTTKEFFELTEYCQEEALEAFNYREVYYQEHWLHVCSHFTREAAEAFIQRKKHDYRDLRIYVEAQPYCWEYNSIIKGILDGKIGLIEQPGA